MYENADKQRISLLVRKDNEPTSESAFRYALEDGVGVFYWIDDACGYALSGRVDKRAAAGDRARRLRRARCGRRRGAEALIPATGAKHDR